VARVLYLNHYAGSLQHGMEFRPFYLSREWIRDGHDVTIVAASYSHLRQQNPRVLESWTEESVDGLRYIWLRTPAYHGNGLARVRNIASFTKSLCVHGRRLAAQFAPDVVIASSTYPFDIFPARSIATAKGAKLIYELHDLWPLSPMELGHMNRWHPFIIATQFAEDYVCRHSDVVVSLLPNAYLHLETRGLARGKFVHIPNGVALEDQVEAAAAVLPAEHQVLLDELRLAGAFVLLYAGAHGLLNNLHIALEAADRLRNELISFVFVGQGPERSMLQHRAQALSLKNVYFLPPVAKSAVPSLLAGADALFLSFSPQPLFRFGISPNKLMDYMLAAKPIVAAMAAGNNPVEEHNCGITVAPDDPIALARAICKLRALPASERAAMGERARRAVELTYSYRTLARRFSTLFAEPSKADKLLPVGS
jgi:glycosyltransferase involved in cell wall biosynthesis